MLEVTQRLRKAGIKRLKKLGLARAWTKLSTSGSGGLPNLAEAMAAYNAARAASRADPLNTCQQLIEADRMAAAQAVNRANASDRVAVTRGFGGKRSVAADSAINVDSAVVGAAAVPGAGGVGAGTPLAGRGAGRVIKSARARAKK